MRTRIGLGILLIVLLPGFIACEGPTVENEFYGNPLVWPQASRLGDSVGWLISSDVFPDPQLAPTPFFTWTSENVTIGLIDDLGYEALPVVPRIVFEAQSAMGAKVRGTNHKSSLGGIIALFDLPAVWPNTANPIPLSLDLVLYVEGQLVASWTNTVEILGSGGSPTAFGIASVIEALEQGPMLRLRPHWEPVTGIGIDPTWLIAGIEFTLTYPEFSNGSITNPRAIPNGDAATALSLAGPVELSGTTNSVKINVLLPEGFKLYNDDCDPSGCYSGRTSLIDIAFSKDSGTLAAGTPVFDVGDFGISNLSIVDPNGVQLNMSSVATDYFGFFVVSNLSVGP